jgi:hypothetical protein
MAVPNMIVTLAMNATKYSQGLKKAASQTTTFGSATTKAFNLAKGALLTLAVAVARFIPNLANMGAESRKADVQLKFMLENLEGIGPATNKTVKAMARYADEVNRATGIDDEQVKAVQRKLLVFDSLRTSAGELGGTFERATGAAIDLAAAGFGDMETNAKKLGKALEEPGKRLKGLADAGIIFTDVELKKIEALKESGDLLGAQEIILQKVEDRVKGLAEETATPFDKLMGKFAEIGDTIGLALLEPLDLMNDKIAAWLSSPNAEGDIKRIVDAFVAMGEAAKIGLDIILFIKDALGFIDANTPEWLKNGLQLGLGGVTDPNVPKGPGPVADRSPASTTVNLYGVTDSVSAGREVSRALEAYNRANGAR